MSRLPNPGGDAGNWGTILNDYLTQAHNDDGTLKPITAPVIADSAITTSSVADAAITEDKLDPDLAAKVNAAPSTTTTMGGDVTGSSDAAVVGGINGMILSGTPSAGKVVMATDDTTVTWGDGTATTLSGEVVGDSTSNLVKKIKGVMITGTPSAGKVLKATSATAAKWQPDESRSSGNVVIISDNYTARKDDVIFADCTDNNIRVTLPAPSNGAYVTVKKTDDASFDLTIVGAGGATIDGKSEWTNTANQTSQRFISDGTNWYLIDVTKNVNPPNPSNGVQARSAFEFLESVATCAKLGDSVYTNVDSVKGALTYTGARYIRSSTTQDAGTLNMMRAVTGTPLSDGVTRRMHAPLIANINGDEPDATIKAKVDGRINWFVSNDVIGDLASLESYNERELGKGDWQAALRRTQPILYSAVKGHANADVKKVKVCGPSLAGFNLDTTAAKITNDSSGRPLYQSFDYGSLHSYPGGRSPETDFPTKAKGEFFTYTGPAPTSSTTFDDRLKLYTKYVTQSQRPIIVTETGYHDYVWPATGKKGHRSTPPKAGGIYMPRLLLENFRIGIARTHVYELADEPHKSEQEAHIGSFRTSGTTFTPKTWGRAMRNLTTILKDNTEVASPGKLPFDWDAGAHNDEFNPMLFQKSDGSFWIVLWRRISVCDYQQASHNGVDITPNPWTRDVSITFGASINPSAVTKYIVNYDSENVTGTAVSVSGKTFHTSVSPLVTIFKVVL